MRTFKGVAEVRHEPSELHPSRPVDLIYPCIVGSRHASRIRFAKMLSDTNQAQRVNNGVCKKNSEKTSNFILKT